MLLERLRNKKKGKRGFTLLELLITMVVIGIIGVMTFAIVSSAMNTFQRQKEIMDANVVKDIILTHLNTHLKMRDDILLTTELGDAGPMLGENEVTRSIIKETNADVVVTATHHVIVDNRLKEDHIIFSEEGRIYTVNSNTEGIYYVENATSSIPLDAVNGQNGKVALFDESLYKGYDVELVFKPILTASKGKYLTLQLVIDITDPRDNNNVVAHATETLNMLNLENKSKEIAVRYPTKEGYDVSDFDYTYCFFA